MFVVFEMKLLALHEIFALSLVSKSCQEICGTFLQRLTCVDLSRYQKFVNRLLVSLKMCRSIQRMYLNGCYLLEPGGLENIIQSNCSTIQEIDLGGCRHLTNQHLMMIAIYCHQLKKFICQDCSKVGEEGLIPLIKANTNSLRHLNFTK